MKIFVICISLILIPSVSNALTQDNPGLRFASFQKVPKSPIAGKEWQVYGLVEQFGGRFMVSAGPGSKWRTSEGRGISCSARIVKRHIRTVYKSHAGGIASCVWKIPKKTAGKFLVGSITVGDYEGRKLTREFGFKVRK